VELLDGDAAEGKVVCLAEILEPLNGRLPVIPGRLSRRAPRLPHGDGFRKHPFGRAVFAGADSIFDDALDLGGEDGQSPGTSLLQMLRYRRGQGESNVGSRARDVEVPMFAVTSIPLVAGRPSRATVFGRVGPLFLHFLLDKLRDL